MADLAGKSVIVTGGAGGIGAATCRVLASSGARLIITDIADAAGEALAEELRSGGAEAKFVRADLSSAADIEALVEAAVKTYGRLDGAFNNAGLEQKAKPMADLTLEEWSHALSIDLTAVFLCMKYQIPAMLKTGGGAIVNTASSLGERAIPACAEYVTAKHGVCGLTKAASMDYSAQGVRINAVLPGVIKTPMITRLIEDPTFGEFYKSLLAHHPIGRLGEPKEIGEATAWLLSDAASFVTGAMIPVDGGYLTV